MDAKEREQSSEHLTCAVVSLFRLVALDDTRNELSPESQLLLQLSATVRLRGHGSDLQELERVFGCGRWPVDP